MKDPAILAAIERNRALANDLRITGTPTFLVGDQIIRGLVELETLQQSIAGAREKPEG
jgi:protein-disulfide isomerase